MVSRWTVRQETLSEVVEPAPLRRRIMPRDLALLRDRPVSRIRQAACEEVEKI